MTDAEEQPNQSDAYAESLIRKQAAATKAGDNAAADEAALKLLAHFSARAASEEPTEELRLAIAADDALEAYEWDAAEAVYGKSLALARSKGDLANQYRSQDKLRGFYQFLGQDDRALEAAQAAHAAAASYGVMPLILASMEALVNSWLRVKDPVRALDTANEMLDKVPESRMYGVRRARGLVCRASCFLEVDSLAQAQADLDLSLPLLTAASTAPLMVGNHSAMANWYAVTAKMLGKLGSGDGAVEACRRAVDCRRIVAQAPQLSGPFKHAALAKSLQHLGEALLVVERPEEAEAASLEADAIRKQVHQP